jgi:hypothetical protein
MAEAKAIIENFGTRQNPTFCGSVSGAPVNMGR